MTALACSLLLFDLGMNYSELPKLNRKLQFFTPKSAKTDHKGKVENCNNSILYSLCKKLKLEMHGKA